MSGITPVENAAAAADQAIAISVVTGFLGSGKTTLLNALLQHPEIEETAVLINEFGEIGLDHLLVTELGEDVVLLASGCICCTVQGALVDSLKGLYMKRLAGLVPPFKRVIIETTGLADPIPIVTCLMNDPLFKHSYRLETLVATVDALYGQGQLDAHAEAVKQVAVADRIVISKVDLADEPTILALRERIVRLNPSARIIPAAHGRVAPSQLFDSGLYAPGGKSSEVQRWLNAAAYDAVDRHGHDHGHERVDLSRHDDHIVTFCVYLERPLAWQPFLDWFDDLVSEKGERLLRVKGLVNIAGEEAPYAIQCVQATRYTPLRLARWPDQDRRSRIVFITYDLAQAEIEASLRRRNLIGLPRAELENRATSVRPGRRSRGASARARWLNDAEIGRAFGALAQQPDHPAADALRLVLLTGARVGDVLAARWDHFDLENGIWLMPDPSSFSGQPRRLRLAAPTCLLLAKLRRADQRRSHLFPEFASGERATAIKELWTKIARAAAIDASDLDALSPTLGAKIFEGLDDGLVRRLLGWGSTGSHNLPA